MVVNIHEAKTHFSRLIERALAGEEVIIARNGKPLVRLTSVIAPKGPRRPGLSRGEVEMAENFDEPLPDGVLSGFE